MPLVTIVMPLGLALVAEHSAMSVLDRGDQDTCKALLSRIVDAGESRGYQIKRGALGLTGRRGRAELEGWCAEGHVELGFLETDGSVASVTFGPYAGHGYEMEIIGRFPAAGTVSRTAILDEARSDRLTGALIFTAEAGGDQVSSGLDFVDGVMAVHGDSQGGDLHRMNAALKPDLSLSMIWKDAHVLGYAAAGAWDSVMREPEIDIILDLAFPLPDVRKVDADSKDSVQKCGGAFVLCVAAAWLPPAGMWACGVALTNCLATLPCLPTDCAGDGV